MNLWYKKASVFVVAGIVYLIGQYFRGAWFVDTNFQSFCHPYLENGKMYCNSPYIETLGWPLIDFGQMFVIVAVILLLMDAETFRKWFKFSIFYIPIAIILTLWMYPTQTLLGAVVPISQGVHFFGDPYIWITFGIFLWGLYTSRRSKRA